MSETPAFRVVIPARYASTRLPGKPLVMLAGKTLIERVFENASRSGAAEVIVATDDERIVSEVDRFGGRALVTSAEHLSGTDRLAEVARREGWADDEVIVNLQGDEPFIAGALLARVARELVHHPSAGVATFATPITSSKALFDPSVVKVVLDDDGLALYFSRAPIPWSRDGFTPNAISGAALPEGVVFLRHLGLYAYRVGSLKRIAAASASPAEQAESLEQLRALALGIRIRVAIIDDAPAHGVDTVEDVQRLLDELTRAGT